MRALAYLVSLILALPAVAFAAGLLVLGHVIATRNVAKLVLDFLVAFGWVVPFLALSIVGLVVAAFLPTTRLAASFLVLALDVAALSVILLSPARPRSLSEAVFLLPALVSVLAVVALIRADLGSKRRPDPATDPRPAPAVTTAREHASGSRIEE